MRLFAIVLVGLAIAVAPRASAAAPAIENALRALGLDWVLSPSASAKTPPASTGRDVQPVQGQCPPGYPYHCGGTQVCCDRPSYAYCQNYQGAAREVPRGWTGCIASNNAEVLKHFSDACALYLECR